MSKHSIYQRLSLPIRRLLSKERTLIGRQRLALLLFCYVPVTFLGIIAIFIGVTGPTEKFFNYTHAGFAVAAVTALYLFFSRKTDVASCLTAITLIGQTTLTIEMIHLACEPTHYNLMVIVANTVLLALNTMISMAALLERNTMILGVATILTYIACTIVSGNEILKNFLVLFIISFSLVGAVGLLVAKSTRNLEKENTQLIKDEYEMLHMLRLKKDEVRAFVAIASKKQSHDITKALLERMDKKSRHNLITNVEEYLLTRATDLDIIEKAFPELTPSEREICRLVLQGKKLGEICLVLGKNESNINSQRANARRKLGLKPSDNLQKKLQERLDDDITT